MQAAIQCSQQCSALQRSRMECAGWFIFGRRLQKLIGFNAQYCGNAVHNIDTGIVDAAFERADIRPVDICTMCEFLLRQPFRKTEMPQISRKNLSYLHGKQRIQLMSI